MAIEFRTITREERDAVLDLLTDWHNDREFFARYFRHEPSFRDDLCFVAVDGGRIVSTLQVFRKALRANDAGAVLQVAGVGNVFTASAYREQRLASTLLKLALAAMREHEFDLSLLFAVRLDFYSRFGWRSHLRRLSFLDPIRVSATGSYRIAPFVPADLGRVKAIYDTFNRGLAGTTVRDDAYWAGQLKYAGSPNEDFLVARDAGEIVAYARGASLGDYLGYYVILEHACMPGHEDALVQLLCRLHGSEATALPGTLAQLATSPAIAAKLQARGITLRTVEDSFWMWQVISPRQVAAKLGLHVAEVEAEDFFDRLFPPDASLYWISDRF